MSEELNTWTLRDCNEYMQLALKVSNEMIAQGRTNEAWDVISDALDTNRRWRKLHMEHGK